MPVTNILYLIVIYPIEQMLEFVFVFFQKVFRETGLSVLGISAAISFLSLPLYMVAEKWQRIERNVQKVLKPKIKKIKAAFRGDERYMILSAYYRQNHYHPVFAMRSTFGLLVQIPFFIAAYAFLSRLEALKGAPFFFISDMSAPDSLVLFGAAKINVLPVIMTLINCAAASLYTRGLELREKLQLYLIALVFLLLLYNAPSGLVIFWTMNNVFSLIKNFYQAVAFKYKKLIPSALLTAACLFTFYHIVAIHKGSVQQRFLIAAISLVIAVMPWLLVVFKNSLKKFVFPISRDTTVFMLSLLVLWTLIGLFIPSMLIVSSPDEFSFIDSYTTPSFFIINTALQAMGLLVFWPVCLYLLFSQKAKEVFTLAAFIFCAGAVCNVFAYPGSYGLISVTMQFSREIHHSISGMEMLFNLAVLFIIAVISIFLLANNKKTRNILIPVSLICAAALFSISIHNFLVIQKSFRTLKGIVNERDNKITEVKPLFTLSKNAKNVVIIMLDRASGSFFPFILEEDPSLNEVFSGFTHYPNTVSFNGYTAIGSPPIFGGYEYTPQEINRRDTEPLVKKHNEALLLLPVLFSKAGYQVTVTDPPFPNYSERDDLSIYDSLPGVSAHITDSFYNDIWLKENDMHLRSASDILRRDILWYSLFKASPPVFRLVLYQRGDWCSSVSGQKIINLLNGYSVLDYLPRLTEINEDNRGTALIMVNKTTHSGGLLQEPEYRPVLNVVSYGPTPFRKEAAYHTNIAAFKRLADWFRFLKDEGVYDNTRIILVSDHGTEINFVTRTEPGMPVNLDKLHPILLVKDFDSAGGLQTDNGFMSNADVPFISLSGLIENPLNPFTGEKITIERKQKPLYIVVSDSVHRSNREETRFNLDPRQDFFVHSDIFNPNNWERVEK